jgi:hypothetical protein
MTKTTKEVTIYPYLLQVDLTIVSEKNYFKVK